MALTTLAAGAAHELSTPLATIAVASRELERALVAAPVALDCSADARLIRQEVDRCQLILDHMSGRAGGSAAETAMPARIDAVMADVVARLTADQVDRLRIQVASDLPSIVAPRAGLVQVLLSLIKNAFDATEPPRPVAIDVAATNRSFRFVVQDQGPGMPPDVLRRAGEPFFTTKEPGRGMGLGLFLARIFAERCGGSLSLRSGRGTVAVLELPAETRAEVA
jgi:two-component system sensor histidine kinase RegB